MTSLGAIYYLPNFRKFTIIEGIDGVATDFPEKGVSKKSEQIEPGILSICGVCLGHGKRHAGEKGIIRCPKCRGTGQRLKKTK